MKTVNYKGKGEHSVRELELIIEQQAEELHLLKSGQKQLPIHGVVKSLPIQDLPNCTRVEVIDQKGRSYVNWKPTNKVRLSMQDDGKTAKIFID